MSHTGMLRLLTILLKKETNHLPNGNAKKCNLALKKTMLNMLWMETL